MGPVQATVKLAELKGMHPFIEKVVSTKDSPVIGLHLEREGQATNVKVLPEGSTVPGVRPFSRTRGIIPRPFRDDASYTLKRGEKRRAYAGIIGKMLCRHPRSPGLRAFHQFLKSVDPCSSWFQKNASYAPFYNGRPVFHSVAKDYDDVMEDPYGEENSDDLQHDVIVGGLCVPTRRKPIRILRSGPSFGTTLFSTKNNTTGDHGWLGEYVHLQVPMSERTMNLHVAGMQWLVDHGRCFTALTLAKKPFQKCLRYYIWTTGGDVEGRILDVLEGRASPEEVEDLLAESSSIDDNLCVFGVKEEKRLQIYAWHYLPVAEAVGYLADYARRFTRRKHVMGIRRVLSCGVLTDSQDPPYDLVDSQTPPSVAASLVDAAIAGHPYPQLLASWAEMSLAKPNRIGESKKTNRAGTQLKPRERDQLTAIRGLKQ